MIEAGSVRSDCGFLLVGIYHELSWVPTNLSDEFKGGQFGLFGWLWSKSRRPGPVLVVLTRPFS